MNKQNAIDHESRRPSGCRCEPLEWSGSESIPDVCKNFTPEDKKPWLCIVCEHDEVCHDSYHFFRRSAMNMDARYLTT